MTVTDVHNTGSGIKLIKLKNPCPVVLLGKENDRQTITLKITVTVKILNARPMI